MQKKDDIGGIPNVEWKKYYLFLEANWFRLIVIGFFIVFFFKLDSIEERIGYLDKYNQDVTVTEFSNEALRDLKRLAD